MGGRGGGGARRREGAGGELAALESKSYKEFSDKSDDYRTYQGFAAPVKFSASSKGSTIRHNADGTITILPPKKSK